MKNKLTSNSGMTLIETLTAVLIASLIAAALAVGIGAALRVYRDSSKLSEAQILSSTLSQAIMDELRYSKDIYGESGPTFTSSTFGPNVSFGVNESGQIVLGGVSLIGGGSYSNGQFKANLDLSYASDSNLFQAVLIVSDANLTSLTSSSFSVRSLNPVQ